MNFVKMIITGVILLVAGLLTGQPGQQFYNGNNEVFTENRYSKVEGSPYLFKEWSAGIIYALDGQQITHPQINFNGQAGKPEVLEPDGRIISLNAVLYNRVEINAEGGKAVFVNHLRGPQDLTYFRQVYGGERVAFLEKFTAEIQDDDVPNYGVYRSRRRFVQHTEAWLLLKGQLQSVVRSKKQILALLDEPKVERYLKKEKLNVKKDEDLRRLLAYFEEGVLGGRMKG